MNIIVAPDKFKGSLSSKQACKSIAEGIKQAMPDAEVLQYPMADGGDGFDEVLAYYLKTETVTCQTFDPLMRPMEASYQWQTTTKTAIISVAAASGLWLLKQEERNALATTTYGTGILIKHAIEKGAEKIILGLGGSATNDAGFGILSALGFKLLDEKGNPVKPIGGNLSLISQIKVPENLPTVKFTIACDVQNVLFGARGAAYVYASQKGADEKGVKELDKALQHVAKKLSECTGKQVENIKGTGAAGGIAAALLSFFNCIIQSGAAIVIKESGIEKTLAGADLLITGEGKLDAQSGYGKVIHELTNTAKQFNIPVTALCGKVAINEKEISRAGLASAYQIISDEVDEDAAISNAANLLQNLAVKVMASFIGNS